MSSQRKNIFRKVTIQINMNKEVLGLYIPFKSAIRATLATVFILVTSCGAKNKVEELQKSLTDVTNHAESFSQEDWDKYDKEIEQVKLKIKEEREKYTEEEAEEMNKMIGKYYAIKAKHKVSNLKKELKDATQQLEGAFETLFKESKDTLK